MTQRSVGIVRVTPVSLCLDPDAVLATGARCVPREGYLPGD